MNVEKIGYRETYQIYLSLALRRLNFCTRVNFEVRILEIYVYSESMVGISAFSSKTFSDDHIGRNI
jgi:hypothetical protein